MKYVAILMFLCMAMPSMAATGSTIAVSSPASAAKEPVQEKKIRIVDDTGYTLELDAPATRILGLYGALSELVMELGMGHTLVGRTSADRNIEGLKHLPAVGTHMRPNPELIVSLKPDVILQFLGRKEASSLGLGLRKLGVPVLLFRLETFEDMYSVLERLGVLTGTEAKAKALVNSYIRRMGFLRAILLDVKRVPVFFEMRYPNLLTAGGKSIVTDILFTAGARNIISSTDRVVRISEEELVAKDPVAYIIQKGPMNPAPKPLQERPHYKDLQAVKNNKVIVVDELTFSRPGPKAVDAAEMLARWLHPHVDFTVDVPQGDKKNNRP